jgi:hypothetical protein
MRANLLDHHGLHRSPSPSRNEANVVLHPLSGPLCPLAIGHVLAKQGYL